MNKYLFISAVIIMLLVGCRPEENPGQLKAVNKSLEYTNEILQDANRRIHKELIEKQNEPRTAAKAGIWRPRADLVQQYADSIKTFIKSIKGELITQSDSFKREYVTVVKQLYTDNGVGYQLLNKLAAFKDSIPAVFFLREDLDNPIVQTYMKKDISHLLETVPLLPGYRDSLPADQRSQYKKKWLEESFGRSSSLMAMIMLNKIESDVLTTEKAFIEYCNIMAVSNFCGYDVFEAIAVLSSSYINSGQSIQVSAGVGAFSVASNPTISINGKVIDLKGRALAEYSFTPIGKPGKYRVPVKIEFTKPDGSLEVHTTELEYIIAEEK